MTHACSVLIVEDDHALLRGLTDNFRNHGYDVRAATDGSQALAAALTQTPDLILLDIMLPRVNGYEVCRQLREKDVSSTIIMLTAKGQEDDIVRGLELGADDYVTKPFSIRELLARAKAILRRRREPPASRYEFGECILDIEAHTLTRGGEAVELTTKEYRLLEFMLLRAGRALTRDAILAAVWGDAFLVNLRSVDRCVTTLRGKIENDPRNPQLIKTIRNVGYRFEG